MGRIRESVPTQCNASLLDGDDNKLPQTSFLQEIRHVWSRLDYGVRLIFITIVAEASLSAGHRFQ